METVVDEKAVRDLAKKIAKDIKTEEDLGDFTKLLRKITVETALETEMDNHLGYEKHDSEGRGSGNSRNGKGTKRLKGDHGEVEFETPRDRDGSFEPQIVRKGQRRLTGMDDQILFLYAKGMSCRRSDGLLKNAVFPGTGNSTRWEKDVFISHVLSVESHQSKQH